MFFSSSSVREFKNVPKAKDEIVCMVQQLRTLYKLKSLTIFLKNSHFHIIHYIAYVPDKEMSQFAGLSIEIKDIELLQIVCTNQNLIF